MTFSSLQEEQLTFNLRPQHPPPTAIKKGKIQMSCCECWLSQVREKSVFKVCLVKNRKSVAVFKVTTLRDDLTKEQHKTGDSGTNRNYSSRPAAISQ